MIEMGRLAKSSSGPSTDWMAPAKITPWPSSCLLSSDITLKSTAFDPTVTLPPMMIAPSTVIAAALLIADRSFATR